MVACDTSEAPGPDEGWEYFPMETGMYWIYNVAETRYAATGAPEPLSYELRVEVTDSFPNDDGTFTWIMERATRPSADQIWDPVETWSVILTGQNAVVREGNTSFVRLTFPIRTGLSWDGNRYNAIGEDEYEIVSVNTPFSAGGTNFEKTVTVVQEDNNDIIVFFDERSEVYARNAGLIFRKIKQLHYCTEDDCRAQQKVEHGIELTQELIDYGQH